MDSRRDFQHFVHASASNAVFTRRCTVMIAVSVNFVAAEDISTLTHGNRWKIDEGWSIKQLILWNVPALFGIQPIFCENFVSGIFHGIFLWNIGRSVWTTQDWFVIKNFSVTLCCGRFLERMSGRLFGLVYYCKELRSLINIQVISWNGTCTRDGGCCCVQIWGSRKNLIWPLLTYSWNLIVRNRKTLICSEVRVKGI